MFWRCQSFSRQFRLKLFLWNNIMLKLIIDTVCAWIFCMMTGWDNMGEIRTFIPCENHGFPFIVISGVQEKNFHPERKPRISLSGTQEYLGRVKQIWYLLSMEAVKVQASLRKSVSPEPPLLAHTSSESRGTFRQKARSLAPLNGWACAVKICHDECSKTQICLTCHICFCPTYYTKIKDGMNK